MQLGRIHALPASSFQRHQTEIEAEIDSLLSLLLLDWSKDSTEGRSSLSSSRAKLIQSATHYIKQNLRRALSISDLCQACNVSERTLQYTFRQHYQCSPKQYIQARRLHAVRKERLAHPHKPIREIASNWGFWHMGQFAADYRKLFGETPSQTRS